jgi:hypothetical protein
MSQELDGMSTREFKSGGAPLLRATLVIALPMALLTAGCASNEPGSTNTRPSSGVAEYRKAVADAEKALGRALNSLAAVSAQSNRCSPKVVAAFSDEFERLEVESVELREHFQAMQARGDAYFEMWHQELAQTKEPKMGALMEDRRPELQELFQKIKALSQEGREAFGPFLSGLRKLRNSLEKDPASLGTQTMQETLVTTRAYGEHVDRCLVAIRRELDSLTTLLTPKGHTG